MLSSRSKTIASVRSPSQLPIPPVGIEKSLNSSRIWAFAFILDQVNRSLEAQQDHKIAPTPLTFRFWWHPNRYVSNTGPCVSRLRWLESALKGLRVRF